MKIRNIIIRASILTVACFCVFGCFSCRDDKFTAPRIDSVWSNMGSQPIEQVVYAYPEQTICLRGEGFTGISKLNVNGTEIDLTDSQIYNTDASIIVALPKEVATTTATGQTFLKVENSLGSAIYEPFYIFESSEKPKISKLSSTILIPGGTLHITGANLDGAEEVYLPLAFNQKILCEFDESHPSTDTDIYVIVPEDVNFAKGQLSIVMRKTYAATGYEYIETLYSDEINFSN